MATATETKPADYAPLTRAGHNAETVLEVEGLQTYLFTRLGVVKAVDDVSFAIRRAETLAIVGESGCGKTMTALSLLRLVPNPPGRIVSGAIKIDGKDLVTLDEAEMRDIRGNEISMIFQEPMTSLNPVNHRDAAPGQDPGGEAAGEGIPAPAVGRHAAARDDRDGAGVQSAGADR